MKIVCDACQAKYSISDDKVQGKVFKIRCKKCSNIIVVRGGAGASEPAPAPQQEKDTRVYDYGYEGGEQPAGGDDAVWHLVINQDQVGPLTVAEVQQKFAAGEVDGETFTWREGFADWLPLSQVDVFAGLVASGSTTHAVGGGGAEAVSAMFGGGDDLGGTARSDPGDLFAAASSSSRAREEDDGGDLFGSSKPAAAQAAAAAGSTKLRGERNENSVLFSLNNLAQLASDKPAMAASSSSSSSSAGHATGAAGGEGSGLIDIRSMASAYLGGSGAAPGKAATASSGIGSIDDLPVFGGGGFSEPAVIVPTARPAASNKVLYLMIAAVGLLAIVAVVMVVVLLKSGKDKPAQVASNAVGATDSKDDKDKADKPSTDTAKPATDTAAGSAAAGSAAAGSAAGVATAGSAATDTGTQVAAADKKDDKTVAHNPVQHNPPPSHTGAPSHSGGQQVAKADKGPPPAKADAPPKADKADAGGGGCDEVSCVLSNYEGACCAKFRKGGAKPSGGTASAGGSKPAGGSDLPDALDRGMISAGIANVKARVTSCGDKSPAKGKVKVHVKVSGNGSVANVAVEATPDPALGACVQAAVQRASFAKTQNGGSFSYPFVF